MEESNSSIFSNETEEYQKIMRLKIREKLIYGHLLSLLTGSLIYLLFRSSTLKMFDWFNYIGIIEPIKSARTQTLEFSTYLPIWFKFSLPDGLWVFSYVCLLQLIWIDRNIKKSIPWILSIPIIAIFSEFGQLTNLVTGTFDPIDLLFYILGMILPFFIINPQKT
ncbi:MAG: hypothetical protein WED10_12755 [Brumimicrobium sp.]